jgi:hypothetical protein
VSWVWVLTTAHLAVLCVMNDGNGRSECVNTAPGAAVYAFAFYRIDRVQSWYTDGSCWQGHQRITRRRYVTLNPWRMRRCN